MSLRFPLIFCLILLSEITLSQKNVTTAGFQLKPIFPSAFFSTGPVERIQQNVKFKWEQSSGFCFGMVVRHGFTNVLSLESGINFVNRHYDLTIQDSGIYDSKSNFRYIGYEIPVSALVYIQLSNALFMNVSMGQSVDMYPSDIYTEGDYYIHSGLRRAWVALAFIANLGFEYRTEKSGYFYLGASFHRPYKYNILSEVNQSREGLPASGITENAELTGNYLTVDLRYFFHQDPEKAKSRKNKKKK